MVIEITLIVIGAILFICSSVIGIAGVMGVVKEKFPKIELKIRDLIIIGFIFGAGMVMTGSFLV